MLKRRLKKAAALATVLLNRRDVAGDITGALLRRQFHTARVMARTAARKPDIGAEKIISRKYRYLWICNPKVASRSIIAALRNVDTDAEIIDGKSVSEVYALYPELGDYHSFAFIRHPFERALSFYSEMRFSPECYQGVQRRHKKEKRQGFFDRCYGLKEVSNFDEYCQWLNTPYGSDACADRHYISQHLQIRRDDGRLPDFIGRLENLSEDLQQVARQVSMPEPKLPMLNTMAGWQPPTPDALQIARSAMRTHLTERSRELLSTRYAADLELGGYSPTWSGCRKCGAGTYDFSGYPQPGKAVQFAEHHFAYPGKMPATMSYCRWTMTSSFLNRAYPLPRVELRTRGEGAPPAISDSPTHLSDGSLFSQLAIPALQVGDLVKVSPGFPTRTRVKMSLDRLVRRLP